MDVTRFAKQSTVRLTTKGRKSGRQHTVTVWFVVIDAQRLAVQHVRGADCDWYKNLVKNPDVQLDFGAGALAAKSTPTTDASAIKRILSQVRKKYWMAWLLHLMGTRNAVAAEIRLVG